MSSTKDTNPKDAIGVTKVPLHLVPETMRAYASVAFLEGALKYGTANWRVAGVRSSIYYAALQRHLSRWWNGEECEQIRDEETGEVTEGVPHLASALACIGIILDSREVGKLTDDRPPSANLSALLARLESGPTAALHDAYGDRNPRHYTIADSEPTPPVQGRIVEVQDRISGELGRVFVPAVDPAEVARRGAAVAQAYQASAEAARAPDGAQ